MLEWFYLLVAEVIGNKLTRQQINRLVDLLKFIPSLRCLSNFLEKNQALTSSLLSNYYKTADEIVLKFHSNSNSNLNPNQNPKLNTQFHFLIIWLVGFEFDLASQTNWPHLLRINLTNKNFVDSLGTLSAALKAFLLG